MANLRLGIQIRTFFNLEWTGVKENVRIFNPMGSESHINSKKQVGRVLRDTLYLNYSFYSLMASFYNTQAGFNYVILK